MPQRNRVGKAVEQPTAVPEAEYVEATECYLGWCTACKEFSREMTEPDATFYKCPACEQNTVCGAEEALVMGFITFTEDAS